MKAKDRKIDMKLHYYSENFFWHSFFLRTCWESFGFSMKLFFLKEFKQLMVVVLIEMLGIVDKFWLFKLFDCLIG